MRRTRGKFVTLMAVLILTCHGFGHVAWGIVYVDADAPGSRNGSSWQNAYRSLEDALNAAGYGDEVRVAQGTYTPADSGPGYFNMTKAIRLQGGYAGYGASNPDARDIHQYETILSGDKYGDDWSLLGMSLSGPQKLLTMATAPYRRDNTRVMKISHVETGGLVDGFTVTGGHSTNSAGGLELVFASVTISRCTFEANVGSWGGALSTYYGTPKITQCVFRLNAASSKGGAIKASGGSPLIINNCLFCRNYCDAGGSGLHLSEDPEIISNPQEAHVTNCTFYANEASAAIYDVNTRLYVTNCILVNVADILDMGGKVARTYTCTTELVHESQWVNGNIRVGYVQFVNPQGKDNRFGTRDDDFHLEASCPCIDAGNNSATGVSSTDLDGRARIVNGIVDMGAYEYGAGSPPPSSASKIDLYDAGESYRDFSPQTFQAGQSEQMMEILFRIGNKGTEAAPSYEIGFYLSRDTSITTSDYFIAKTTLSPLQAGGSQGWRVYGVEFPVHVPTGEYYVGWIIDPDNKIAETDESNNTAYKEGYKCTVTRSVRNEPDLVDAGESYRSFTPRTLEGGKAGQNLTICSTVRNRGTGRAETCTVRCYASLDTTITSSDYLLCQQQIPALDPDRTYNFCCLNAFPTTIPAGVYYVGWIIDAGAQVAESDETNNSAYKQGYRLTVTAPVVTKPDLRDQGQSGRGFMPQTLEAGKAGQNLLIWSSVVNSGGKEAGACKVRFYASLDTNITSADSLLAEVDLPAVGAASVSLVRSSGAFPVSIPPGVYWVGWIIDADNQVDESNENNNTAFNESYQLTVTGPAGKPDLRSHGDDGNRGFMPQEVEAGKPGQQLLIWSNAANGGTADANACKVRCYASADKQITPADALLAEYDLPALSAGVAISFRTSEPFPTTIGVGIYWVGWIIDADYQIDESDEDNNVTYKQGYPLIVTGSSEPDLYDLGPAHQSVEPDPPVVRVEDGTVTPATFRVRLKVGNQGAGNSPVCTLHCYASTDTVITAADTLLGEVQIPALAGGDSTDVVIEAACPIDTPQGFYTIGWIIDADDQVTETDETNNTGFLESPQLFVHYPQDV